MNHRAPIAVATPARRRRPAAPLVPAAAHFDELEERRLFAAPVIGSFTVNPNNVVTVGTTVTLTASNVTGTPGIAKVTFYRESNNVPGLQIGSDVSLGNGNASGNNYSRTATIAMRNGYYTLYAVATDTATPALSTTATTTLSVGNLASLGQTNDNYVNGTPITTVVAGGGTTTINGTTLLATREAGEPLHAGRIGGRSVWYYWTPATSGRATITTSGSAFDTLLGVYTGSTYGALTTVASNDNNRITADGTSAVAFNAIAGRTYRIAIDGVGGLAGNYALNISQALPVTVPPVNDDFQNATLLTGGVVHWSGSTVGATLQNGEIAHAGKTVNNGAPAGSVWFRWTAPASVNYTVSTAGSSFDTVLGVYRGFSINPPPPLVAGSDDNGGPGNTSEVTFQAFAGVTYHIAIAGYGIGAAGAALLSIRPA